MLSLGFNLGGDRVARLIIADYSIPLLFTSFCDKISSLADAIDSVEGLTVKGWKRLQMRDAELGARIKLQAAPDMSLSDIVAAVTEVLGDVYNCDMSVYNQRYKGVSEGVFSASFPTVANSR